MSIVPPCLKTGANFGMSAFLSALSTIVEMGAVGEVVHRLTDSGPDNECASTHALNCTVVHVGATNRLRWLRLHPKHSHNLADRYNAMVKQQMWPQGGVLAGTLVYQPGPRSGGRRAWVQDWWVGVADCDWPLANVPGHTCVISVRSETVPEHVGPFWVLSVGPSLVCNQPCLADCGCCLPLVLACVLRRAEVRHGHTCDE